MWAGRVAIHPRFLNKANQAGEDLTILCGDESMTIKHCDLKNAFTRGNKEFKDKKTGKPYFIYYLVWKPVGISNKQASLL